MVLLGVDVAVVVLGVISKVVVFAWGEDVDVEALIAVGEVLVLLVDMEVVV